MRRGWRDLVGAVTFAAVIAIVVLPFYLATYRQHLFQTPLGWDTSKYLWRTHLAAQVGVTNLPAHLPPPTNGSPDRPAFPVIALTLSALTHISTFHLAAALPAASAAALGLAAGAFVAVAFARPWWQAGLVALSVATSLVVARLAAPETYQDNLFAGAALLGALALTVLALRDRRGIWPVAVLLGATALIHWASLAFVLLLIAGAAVVFLPRSLRERREGRAGLRTPSGTLAGVVGGAVAAAAASMYGLLGAGPVRPALSHAAATEYAKKLDEDLPTYDLPFVLPVAAVGGASLVAHETARHDVGRRFALVLFGGWLAVTIVAIVLGEAGVTAPAHRSLAFALPLPILVALGALKIGGLVGRWRRAAGIAVALAILALSSFAAERFWLSNHPWMEPQKEREVANAAAYLDAAHVPASAPVIYLVDDRNGRDPEAYIGLVGHMVRAALPPGRISEAYLYVGDPDRYVRGEATILPGHRAYDLVSWRYMRPLRPLLPRNPVAVITRAMDPTYYGSWVRVHPGSVVAPNVAVVSGAALPHPLTTAAPSPVGRIDALVITVQASVVFAILYFTGLGWSIALLGRRAPSFVASALAPGIAFAALVVVGVLVDRLGFRLTGGVGAGVVVATLAAGYISAWIRLGSERRQQLQEPADG